MLLSPSTRRAWIEISNFVSYCSGYRVALHPEGVDRNAKPSQNYKGRNLSPSTRRAWIEIAVSPVQVNAQNVALHPEGVDRNKKAASLQSTS